MWNEIGRLQFDYLVSQGLKPEHRLLDVGCGCLRGGVHFVSYLDNGNYYGIDKNEYLLDMGREEELPAAGLADRQLHLLCSEDFDFSRFGTQFDYALAQSVFTHLPTKSILRCLEKMKRVLAPGGAFYATFFEDVSGVHKISPMMHFPGGVRTFPHSDPYHYEFSALEELGRRTGLKAENLGEWNHPRGQRMVVFRHGPANRAFPLTTPHREKPVLSVIVVVFNMEREAPRTLRTLTANYQNVSPEFYEVLVVDNGSSAPLGYDAVRSISEDFSYMYLSPSHPSPAAALNEGARRAKGRLLGFVIDGARMLSPGVLQYAIRASRCYQNPVISTLGFHLGPDPQPVSVSNGYNQEVEDRLLESVDWQHNGYELFRIASFAGSSRYGWFSPIAESNCVFVTRETFNAIGGFETAFDFPGGGMINLDFYRRACEHPETELVTLLGEGSFHQFHNGAMTGQDMREVKKRHRAFERQYRKIQGKSFRRPLVRCDYLGHTPPLAHPSLLDSFKRFGQFRREKPDEAQTYEEEAIPPNSLGVGSPKQKTILILGMHRSGTSMLAGSLQEAGLVLGDVITKAPHNPKGNRENRAIMLMHEELLASNGGSWDNPPKRVRWGRLHEAVRDLFISSFREERIWGFKDPRTLLTLDGWLEVLPEAEFVGIFRHPSLVALSLKQRNNLSPKRSFRLWQIYNERLLDLHKEHPFPLIEFHDDAALLRDKLQQLTKVLDLPFKHRTLNFFEEGLRRKSETDLDLPPDVYRLYVILRDRMT